MSGPSVDVIVATRDRPELLARALSGIMNQDYDGPITCTVVFDRSEPDCSIAAQEIDRRVLVTTNERADGLAGARNSGLERADGDLVAFCDDDDEWLPTKITAQVRAMAESGGARAATTGIIIRYEDRETVRMPVAEDLTFDGFLDDRMTEVHPSTFLFDREWLLDEVGLVDEELPGSYAEDYDLLLRVARRTKIAVAAEPLTVIWWHPQSFFADRWEMIDLALEHLTDKHPEFASRPRGLARIRGQQAFAAAARGERRRAVSLTRETLGLRATEKRGYLALVVATGLISADRALRVAHRFGRGI
jgi:glycosyltransferase involved in cell wall biosynthesis